MIVVVLNAARAAARLQPTSDSIGVADQFRPCIGSEQAAAPTKPLLQRSSAPSDRWSSGSSDSWISRCTADRAEEIVHRRLSAGPACRAAPVRRMDSAPVAEAAPERHKLRRKLVELLVRARQVRALRSCIRDRQRHSAGQFALYIEIPLLRVGVRIVVESEHCDALPNKKLLHIRAAAGQSEASRSGTDSRRISCRGQRAVSVPLNGIGKCVQPGRYWVRYSSATSLGR